MPVIFNFLNDVKTYITETQKLGLIVSTLKGAPFTAIEKDFDIIINNPINPNK